MSEIVDLEVGRFALRTFRVTDSGVCTSIAFPDIPSWVDGVCSAKCYSHRNHETVPELECTCGIYGSLSYRCLVGQYPEALKLTAVMAAEGTTIIGTRGLRTQRARVVAYHYSLLEWPIGQAIKPRWVARHCESNFPGAKRYKNPRKMIDDHGLEWGFEPGQSANFHSALSAFGGTGGGGSNWWTS